VQVVALELRFTRHVAAAAVTVVRGDDHLLLSRTIHDRGARLNFDPHECGIVGRALGHALLDPAADQFVLFAISFDTLAAAMGQGIDCFL
jgi:hypothetical protein